MWRYQPVAVRPGQPTLRLIVSADAVNAAEDLPVVLAVHVVDEDPGSLLAVRAGGHGWARALSIEPVMRRRLVERVDALDGDTMDAVDAALRAVQDL
ncbi:type II toxin-antitoxin system PemK/MazF family toxin [Dactylosporangium sp. CA-152071]|uniref:type II toxin-antitoxin system PemK/MazF family toxin n=1 Tax=Dactylosporangium sp. CA-152071 TaxID=3239933 RepID=UPI003D94F8AA